jgi:hypothetical protein
MAFCLPHGNGTTEPVKPIQQLRHSLLCFSPGGRR